jgi:hypothetical protein
VLAAAVVGLLSAWLPSASLADTPAGIIPQLPGAGPSPARYRAAASRAAKLHYQGGPVLHKNRTHVIFWLPSGSRLSYDPGYQPLVEKFLRDVAADSHKPTNVYSLSGQYHDKLGGVAAYSSTFGGAVLATDRLPANGCSLPSSGPGWSVCLSDAQIQAEIEHVVSAHHLRTRSRDIYFLVTPRGLGSCLHQGPTDCTLGGAAVNGNCGYHSITDRRGVLYALIPYTAVPGGCNNGNPRPNRNAADPALSVISHEHIETITDPIGDAWTNSSSVEVGEVGDLCYVNFGGKLGGKRNRAYNQVIHGGHYYLQQEWSNDDHRCASREESYRVHFSVSGQARRGTQLRFNATGRDPDGRIRGYAWVFGDGRHAGGHSISHTFRRAGSFRVQLRITGSDGNWEFASRTIRIRG